MEIIEEEHLVIASVDCDEAAKGAWRRAEIPVDIVRLTNSAEFDEQTLTELGFVARPYWINWCAPGWESPEEFEASLGAKERRHLRAGRRFVRDHGLTIEVRSGLTVELMDEFLVLYDRQIEAMPRGSNFARRWRDRLLAAAGEHLTVCMYAAGTMTVGSIWRVRSGDSLLQLRFSASDPLARSHGLLRVAYAEALRAATENELGFASLGNDPSLFGHVVQPGLFGFKSRFGFTPIPSQVIDPSLAGEVADMVLSLRSLSDPALMVTWGALRGALPDWPAAVRQPGLDVVVLASGPEVEAERITARRFRTVSRAEVPARPVAP